MLDDLQDQIRSWLAEHPGVTATDILVRIKELHPNRFTDKQARTVQRAVKHWRALEARRIIIESAAAISAGVPIASQALQYGRQLSPPRLAPEGPQAPPTRAAPSLVRALRNARGARPWTSGTTRSAGDTANHR